MVEMITRLLFSHMVECGTTMREKAASSFTLLPAVPTTMTLIVATVLIAQTGSIGSKAYFCDLVRTASVHAVVAAFQQAIACAALV